MITEAHKIKLKADNLEAFELEKMRNQHQVSSVRCVVLYPYRTRIISRR